MKTLSTVFEFDIWRSSDGRLTARPATKAFVDDSDAPYTFCTHELRVTAKDRKTALAEYYSAKKAVCN